MSNLCAAADCAKNALNKLKVENFQSQYIFDSAPSANNFIIIH